MSFNRVVLLAFAMAVLTPLRSHATPVPLSDSFTVFDPTGAIFAQVLVDENGVVSGTGAATTGNPAGPESPVAVYYLTDTSLVNATPTPATSLWEDNNRQFFSDVFGIDNIANVGSVLAFASDTETLPEGFGGIGTLMAEGNGMFDATQYLNLRLQTAGYTAQFISDAAVPEPASLTLLGLGLGAARLLRRRRAA